MGDKDPPPFGYTFSSDYFHGASTPLDAHGQPQSLLSDMENQSLADFFSNTDPFHLPDAPPFASPADTKLAGSDFADWNFMTPATVHGVSATIPDQAQLHLGFPGDGVFAPHATAHATAHAHAHALAHLPTTHDDLQAASTLFNNAHQPAYMADRTHSFHDIHNIHDMPAPSATNRHSISSTLPPRRPMVATSQGLLNEQLAALLPNHAAAGTLDAQLAAQWAGSNAHVRHEAEFGPMLHRPSLKRSYTFGTDDSFNNPAGFSAPNNETEEQVTRRLMRDMRHSQTFIPDLPNPDLLEPTRHTHHPADDASEGDSEETSSADDDLPAKKRMKKMQIKKEDHLRKTAPGARVAKPKKPSPEDSKKKRASAAAQKLQRENLSEEQKRSNHILSEQKRRNLIKRGFDDLHDLVPEIRNGGLSKSSVLTEAANFLDKLIEDNKSLLEHISASG